MQNPDWRAQRHRRGRRPEGCNYPRPKLDLMLSPSYCRLVETGGRRRRRAATFASLTCAPAGVGRCRSAREDWSTLASSGPKPAIRNNRDRRSRGPAAPPPSAGSGAARHSKVGTCFAIPRWQRPFLTSQQTAPIGRASRRPPARREPCSLRSLALPLATTRW
jgi:hypothetical protein